jgi:hypothetical protein
LKAFLARVANLVAGGKHPSLTNLIKAATRLGREYFNDPSTGDAFTSILYRLRVAVYEADKDISLSKVEKQYVVNGDDQGLTRVEHIVWQAPKGEIVPFKALAAADKLKWLPRGEKFPNDRPRIWTTAKQILPFEVNLFSDVFTFTSTHAVLFELTDSQYAYHKQRKGVVDTNVFRITDEYTLVNPNERLALLQYSVALSAVHHRLQQLDNFALTNIHATIPELKTIVSEQHPVAKHVQS